MWICFNYCYEYLSVLRLFPSVSSFQPPPIINDSSWSSSCCDTYTALKYPHIKFSLKVTVIIFIQWLTGWTVESLVFLYEIFSFHFIFFEFCGDRNSGNPPPPPPGGGFTVDPSKSCRVNFFWNIGTYDKLYLIGYIFKTRDRLVFLFYLWYDVDECCLVGSV